jgi:hypothetical protein
MKFFSNDAKENDDSGYERSDVATSEPVAVPQQRAGSPWNDTPGDPVADYREPQHRVRSEDEDAEIAEQELRDGTAADERTDPSERTDSDSGERTEADEPQAERISEPVTTTYGPDGTVTTSDEPVDEDRRVDDERVDEDERVRAENETDEDRAIDDKGTFDSPEAVDPATGESLEEADDRGKEPEATGEQPAADEPVAEERGDEINGAPVAVDTEPVPARHDDATPAEGEAVAAVAAVPVEAPAAATPGSVPEQQLDRLFSDSDSFAERFRDIQLRFVDSPKEATSDAAALVGEAVDKLTAALRSQKDALGGDSDDTEQLRVRLRGYRDLLNRLTGL